MARPPTITFAVVGHNEADSLEHPLSQAREAARLGEPVWFVDSGSTDGSAARAAALGAEVVRAEVGKGRAMAAAAARCRTSHLCFLDADLLSATRNVPLALRGELERSGASMVIADFDWRGTGVMSHIEGVWRPVVGDLFPEAVAIVPRFPLSGFRVLEAELARGPLPPGFGAETHLNIRAAVEGRPTSSVDVGVFEGAIRRQPTLAADMAAAIFDLAERHGRLEPSQRPAWEAWVEEVDAEIGSRPRSGAGVASWPARLTAAAERPRPPRLQL